MAMSLKDWQQRLAATFDDVTLAKLDQPHEPVTFALEHGLDKSDLSALRTAVCGNVRSLRLDDYLCWAVYAAEVGYQYAGDEYWHTFREQTPRWDQRDRPFIKKCFQKFSKEYNGAIPRGSWAQHRSIICWPITHAILPKDLQRQLAEVLYRVRHSVVLDDVESPGQLGRIIAANSLKATSRFKQLASEPELIGQIASALLRDDRTGEWIEPTTLARITTDLNVEEQARSWLNDAKHYVSRRATVRGLKRPGKTTTNVLPDRSPRPQIRPAITLRPHDQQGWRPVLESPNLTPLVRYYPDLQPLFERASVRFARHQRLYSARALLHSSLPVPQSDWPQAGSPLLTFNPTHPDLDALLAHTATMPEGPWLFRLNADGVAHEVKSRRVSTDGEYIVVTPACSSSPEGERVDIGCEDYCGWHFGVSSLDDMTATLNAWGLVAARQVIAKPCGLVPCIWDRQGSAEWLSTDQPLIQLTANYSIARFSVTMDVGASTLEIDCQPSTQNTAYLALPSLPSGVYNLEVIAHPTDSSFSPEHGEMEITIRDVSPDKDFGVAMLVTQQPSDGTLVEFFDGQLEIQVLGPPTRNVLVTLALKKKGRIASLYESEPTSLNLPISAQDFTRFLSALVGQEQALSNAYAEADRCVLRFDGGDIGITECQFDRPPMALRWGLAKTRDNYAITLYDDVDDPTAIEISRYEFSTPLREREVSENELIRASNGSATPGLYVARTPENMAATIVPASADQLRAIKPRFFRPERSVESVERFLETIEVWYGVDSRGNLFGRFAWRVAIRALTQQLVGLISGTAWYKAERAYQNNNDLEVLSRRIAYKHYGLGWSKALIEAIDDLANAEIPNRISCLSAVTSESSYLCEFVLRLTSEPASIKRQEATEFRRTIETIMQRSELTRAARFVVLTTTAKAEPSDGLSRATYPGWQWN